MKLSLFKKAKLRHPQSLHSAVPAKLLFSTDPAPVSPRTFFMLLFGAFACVFCLANTLFIISFYDYSVHRSAVSRQKESPTITARLSKTLHIPYSCFVSLLQSFHYG
jgi:hypothetical protein